LRIFTISLQKNQAFWLLDAQMAASGKKQYGLIIPKKAKEAPKIKSAAVFGGDSSSEDEQVNLINN